MPIGLIKTLVVVTVVGLLTWGAVSWRKNDIQHWKDVGRAELTKEIEEATALAEEVTKQKQSAERKATKKRKEVIYEENDDRPVGPLLNRFYNSLR